MLARYTRIDACDPRLRPDPGFAARKEARSVRRHASGILGERDRVVLRVEFGLR
jgi:hypothetical protein